MISKALAQQFLGDEDAGWHIDLYNVGVYDSEFTMPEDVRQLFSLHSKVQQAQQRIDAETKSKETFKAQMDRLLDKITQTGTPLVAKMPNGDTYVLYNDSGTPTVEKVNVVNL